MGLESFFDKVLCGKDSSKQNAGEPKAQAPVNPEFKANYDKNIALIKQFNWYAKKTMDEGAVLDFPFVIDDIKPTVKFLLNNEALIKADQSICEDYTGTFATFNEVGPKLVMFSVSAVKKEAGRLNECVANKDFASDNYPSKIWDYLGVVRLMKNMAANNSALLEAINQIVAGFWAALESFEEGMSSSNVQNFVDMF